MISARSSPSAKPKAAAKTEGKPGAATGAVKWPLDDGRTAVAQYANSLQFCNEFANIVRTENVADLMARNAETLDRLKAAAPGQYSSVERAAREAGWQG